MIAPQTGFHLMLGYTQHGVPRDLGSRPGRCRYGDAGYTRTHERLSPSHQLQVVEDGSWMCQHCRHGLARVDHAATSDGDHHVAALASGHRGGLVESGPPSRRVLEAAAMARGQGCDMVIAVLASGHRGGLVD